MKNIFTLAFLIFSLSSFGQSLEERMSNDCCNCFEQLEMSDDVEVVLNTFQNECFKEVLYTYKNELEKIADTITSVPDYQKGYYLGHNIGCKSMALMVENCEEFYQFIDKRLTYIHSNTNEESLTKRIDSLNSEIKLNPSHQLYYNRATNYLGLKKYKPALRDLDKVIKVDDKHVGAYMIRGLIHLLSNKYELALTDFELAKKLTNSPKVELFIALSKRKMRK